ncbi:MAG TPA: YdeI/OmpD-associated family protein [Bacteroidales bacterium]|nr:YdeI/OmpD-associated family protein [Bacteroidales bacterium]
MEIESLLKKMHIKPGNRLLLLNSDADFIDAVQKSNLLIVETRLSSGDYDAVLLYVNNSVELQKFVTIALKAVLPSTAFWVAYPKGSSGAKTDITRDKGWEPITGKGFIPVSQVSVDEKWSVLRFKPESQVKKITRGNTTGNQKELVIPADFLETLTTNHLLIAFEKMAFTHRKEYIRWIEEAKKEETRCRRISKAAEMISQNKKLS